MGPECKPVCTALGTGTQGCHDPRGKEIKMYNLQKSNYEQNSNTETGETWVRASKASAQNFKEKGKSE